MVAEEKIAISYEVKNSGQFLKSAKDAEKALRDQAKALDLTARELSRQVIELKKSGDATKEKVSALKLEAQAARISSQEAKAKIAILREETSAVKSSAAEHEKRARELQKAETKRLADEAKKNAQALKEEAAAAKAAAKEQEALAKAAEKAAQKQQTEEAKKKAKALKEEADAAKAAAKEQDKLAKIAAKDAAKKQAEAEKAAAKALKEKAKAAKEAAREQEKLNDAITSGLPAALSGLASPLGVIAALSIAITAGTTAVVKSADEYNTLQARIRGATEATQDYIGVSRELNRISQQTGSSLESNVDLFQRLRFAADALGASNQDILSFSESIAKLGTISGASVTDLKNATVQLGQALTSPKVQAEEINSILDSFPGLAKRIEQGLGILPGQLKNAVKEGKVLSKDVFQAILKQGGDINKEFEKFPKNLGRSAETAKNSFDQFSSALDNALGITNLLADSLQGIANIFNGLTSEIIKNTTQIKLFKNEIGRFIEFAGVVDPFNPSTFGKNIDKLKQDVEDKYNQNLIQIGLDTAFDAAQKTGVSDKKGAGFNAVDEDGLAKKERAKIATIKETLDNAYQEIDLEFSKRLELLGAFVTDFQRTELEVGKTASKTIALGNIVKTLLGTNVSTKEGVKAREDLFKDLRFTAEQNRNQVLGNRNDLNQQQVLREISDRRQAGEVRLGNLESERESKLLEFEETTDKITEEYNQRQVSIEDYYKRSNQLLDYELEAERAASAERLKILRERIADAEKINDDAAKREAEKQVVTEDNTLGLIEGKIQTRREVLRREQAKDLRQAAVDFGDGLESAISNAITEAFDGTGPLKALKNFANNMKNLIVGTLGDAIAQGFRQSKAFQGIADFFGNLFNRLSGNAKGNIATPASPGLNITKGGLLKGGIGALLLGGGQLLSSKGGNSALAGLGGTALGAAGGALAGSMFGPVGTIAGALLGGISSASSNAKQGGFWSSKGGVATAFALGGPLGFLALGASKKRKQEEERQRQQKIADELVNRAMTGADQNNLLDLQSRKNALVNNNKGLTGSRVKTIRDAANQLQALIDARKKSIDEALKEFAKQNKDLADQVALNDAKPFEKAALERQIAIRQIQFDTQKLLDQFKDSEKAKTAILEQEALKRKLLQQEENEAAKQTVEDLADLLKQRDEVANSNVFQRAKSAEQIKKEALQNLDKDIASAYLTLQGQLAAGATPGNTASLNQILAQAGQLGGQQNTLNIVINEANNPAMVQEALTRAFAAFTQKIYGANVA